ncbi:hypothetical protein [Mesorhizobium sp. 1B3]|uniref:hypothetical protein n=1 Tax=Mesorhizobium sp. 1B3 TaxID=3243599 RepID=UPI003D993548
MHSGEERGFNLGAAGSGALRVALLFGLMGVALTLIVVPLAERRTGSLVAGELDMMTTGSIRSDDTYTIRRSVLQPSRDAVCIIRSDGSRSGEC